MCGLCVCGKEEVCCVGWWVGLGGLGCGCGQGWWERGRGGEEGEGGREGGAMEFMLSPWRHFFHNHNIRRVSTCQDQPGQDRVCMRDMSCVMFNVF